MANIRPRKQNWKRKCRKIRAKIQCSNLNKRAIINTSLIIIDQYIYIMSISQLLAKENSPNNEIKEAIRKFLSKNTQPKSSIEYKDKLAALASKWNSDGNNQPETTSLLQYLSNVQFEDGQEYLAAKALEQIKLNEKGNGLEEKDRVEIQIRICELLIATGDIYSAESTYRELKQIKSFNNISNMEKQDRQFLEMRYKLIDAQFLRHLGKHADAGLIYLSYIGNPKLQEFTAQRDSIVESAIVCVILANQSSKKASLLANLYSNEIVMKHRMFGLIERVLLGNIISKEESQIINKVLTTSEKKITEDGITPLQGAVFQHNMRCLPKLYGDISFATLGELLGVDSKNTNFFLQLQKMVFAGFPAQIDQVKEIVTFTKSEASEKDYNQRIIKYCEALDRCLNL